MCHFNIKRKALEELARQNPKDVANLARTLGKLCEIEKQGEIGSLFETDGAAIEPRERVNIADVETDYSTERMFMLYEFENLLHHLNDKANRARINLLAPNIFPKPGRCRATLEDFDHAAADLLQAYCLA